MNARSLTHPSPSTLSFFLSFFLFFSLLNHFISFSKWKWIGGRVFETPVIWLRHIPLFLNNLDFILVMQSDSKLGGPGAERFPKYSDVKVKLYLCTPWRHARGGGTRSISQFVRNPEAGWRCAVSFTPQLLYPRGKSPSTYWAGGCLGLMARLVALERGQYLTVVQPVA